MSENYRTLMKRKVAEMESRKSMPTITSLEKKIKIETLKKFIEYHKQVRAERKETFEYWDRNSANLIAQYEKELADAESK